MREKMARRMARAEGTNGNEWRGWQKQKSWWIGYNILDNKKWLSEREMAKCDVKSKKRWQKNQMGDR